MDPASETITEVLEEFKTGKSGLSQIVAEGRLQEYGKNVIEMEKIPSFFTYFLREFKNFLAWLLLIVALVAMLAGIFLQTPEQIFNATLIFFIVLLNALVGSYQAYSSDHAVQLIKSMLKNRAVVMRDGHTRELDAELLVPGDVILVKQGDKVPAGARIISCEDFLVDESLLTGESLPVRKHTERVAEGQSIADKKNMVFMGTFVIKGQATAIVVATGKQTEIGKIAKSLTHKETFPFIEEISSASKKIAFTAIALIIIVLAIYFLRNHHWLTILLIGSALIIGSIPEGLPAIVTFSLAIASRKLAKKNVLVKRQALLETLGSVDVICTDKTGTLTKNKMSVVKAFVDGKEQHSFPTTAKDAFVHFRNCSILCNEAKDTPSGFIGDAEDTALIDYFNQAGIDIQAIKKTFPIMRTEPFSSATKIAKSFNFVDEEEVEYVKGAPEEILKLCTKMHEEGKTVSFSKERKTAVEQHIETYSKQALRNIAFSYKKKDGEYIFLGFVGLLDPPKENIQATIQTIYDAGISIKMLTGDTVETAKAVAERCGFKNIRSISWDELKDLSKEDLTKAVETNNVFARISPEEKLKIVTALQENGHIVAITGDGVNDAPALRKAEVGVAMGGGCDLAKDAADLVILDDDLGTIVDGIKEGRTVFSNVRKVVNYLLTANLAEVLVVFIASLFGLVPFLAIHLLWVNFVTDIAPAMALGVDPSPADIMKRKPTGKGEHILNRRIIALTVFIGLKKVFIIFLVFLTTYTITHNLVYAQTASFTWLVLSHFVRVAAIRFDEKMGLFVNHALTWSIIIPILLQLLIMYTPLSTLFHVVPLGIYEWAFIAVMFVIGIWLAKVVTTVIDRHIPVD